ncbi:MAG: hypothetical protein WC607_00085 [Candidatus Micrarchaeia archaeon]
MADEYLERTKTRLEREIPSVRNIKQFEEMERKIRAEIEKKENEQKLLIRSFKTLVLGDWRTEEQKQVLKEVKEELLKEGYYAKTIDAYCDVAKRDGLPTSETLESCCINHQVLVMIDGENPGTVAEQAYLSSHYPLHTRLLFFIKRNKFNKLKNKPSEYIKNFPTIIVYDKKIAKLARIFVAFRLHRLAEIVKKQEKTRRGPYGSNYQPMKKRVEKPDFSATLGDYLKPARRTK